MNIVVQCTSPAETAAVMRKIKGGSFLDTEGPAEIYIGEGKFSGWVDNRFGWYAAHAKDYPYDKIMSAADFLGESGVTWIKTGERQPEMGQTVILATGNLGVLSYSKIRYLPVHNGWAYWIPAPALPEPPPIKVGEHKVEFSKDGSVRVGCTAVTSTVMDSIIKRRAEVLRDDGG